MALTEASRTPGSEPPPGLPGLGLSNKLLSVPTYTWGQVIETWPGSLRSLARAAKVPPSTLVRLRSGELKATREVSRRIAEAFETVSNECRRMGAMVRHRVTLTGGWS
jgi:hypothetical protein